MGFLFKLTLAGLCFFNAGCEIGNPHAPLDFDTNEPEPVPAAQPEAQPDSIVSLVYFWQQNVHFKNTIAGRIPPPVGFSRLETEKGSFAEWLRHLPLKPPDVKVYLYNGELKTNQSAHHSVIDMDTGNKDLQQCADAIMRLRAEYFYGIEAFSKIHFNYTSGHKVAFEDWMVGRKPKVSGNNVNFTTASENTDNSYANFRKYMEAIFSYAGTASLSKEMKNVRVDDLKIGDVFIQGGFPGHAVIVVDMAENNSGEKCFLLAQSFMPAQEMHILNNFNDEVSSPWYSIDFGETLYTPEWTFSKNDLKRFVH